MPEFADQYQWERAIIMELNAEHEYVCSIFKVFLRPITIQLFDSDSTWGQYDPATRTISISRTLVREHSWQNVLGVFRHEMAHQFVDEKNPTSNNEKPHGEAFKNACKLLGVPDQYSFAGMDLKSNNFNWQESQRSSKTEIILDKVRKLLALAGSSNEHEALLAMEKVRELYVKYNLEFSQSLQQEGYIHLNLTHGKKGQPDWLMRIASLLSEHFFVRTLICRQFDPNTGDRLGAIEVIGLKENVLMAEYVFHFLIHQIDLLIQEKVKSKSGLHRSDRTSFKLGIIDGFSRKLELSKLKPVQENTSQQHLKYSRELTVVGQALDAFKKNSAIDSYIDSIYPRIGSKSKSTVNVNSEAFSAGSQAGAAINLHKPVEEQSSNNGLLLGHS